MSLAARHVALFAKTGEEDVCNGCMTDSDLSDIEHEVATDVAKVLSSAGRLSKPLKTFNKECFIMFYLRAELNKLNKSPQILRGSFSAVWTATIATK